MANWNEPRSNGTGFGGTPGLAGQGDATVFDAGLRRHMLSIYNYMTSGVLLTGIVALLFQRSQFFELAYRTELTAQGAMLQPTGLGWIIQLSPLAFMLFWWFGAKNASEGTLKAAFWGFCVAFGLSLSTIFAIYTGESIAMAFFSTSAAFAGLSLWGYTTKKDLSGFGTFLIMGVVGLLVAMLLNMFLQSGALAMAISVIGVLIFAGLTAYDTQRLKDEYSMVRGTAWAGKAVIFGALNLYLDFINMFLFILRLFGSRE